MPLRIVSREVVSMYSDAGAAHPGSPTSRADQTTIHDYVPSRNIRYEPVGIRRPASGSIEPPHFFSRSELSRH